MGRISGQVIKRKRCQAEAPKVRAALSYASPWVCSAASTATPLNTAPVVDPGTLTYVIQSSVDLATWTNVPPAELEPVE